MKVRSAASARGSGLAVNDWALVAATLVAAIVVLIPGLLGSYLRLYESWSGERLSALAQDQNAVASAMAPVTWLGNEAFTVGSAALVQGSRVEVKLRTADGEAIVRLLVDGQPQGRFHVGPAWKTYRVWLKQAGSRLQLDEPGTLHVPVHMARIKITNVGGFTEGILNAWIVRRDVPFRRADVYSRWGLFLLLVLTSALVVRPRSGHDIGWARVNIGMCASGIALSAAALGAGRLLIAVLGFRLIVTPGTAAAILLGSGAAGCVIPFARRFEISRLRAIGASRGTWESVAVVLCIAAWSAALFVVVQGRFWGDIRGMARFGWKFYLPAAVEDVPELGRPGYDGQFYAVLASDPFLRNPETIRGLDNPGYRATRILVPLLAWVSVGGSSRRAPFVYVLWCWVLGLMGPLLLFLWYRRSAWRLLWFAALSLNAGLVVSVLRATPDAAALTLMLGALLLAEAGAPLASTGTGGAMAVLARETSWLALPGVVWPDVKAGRWRRVLVLLGVPAIVFGSWRLYVRSLIHRGFGSAWTNFGLPFAWLPEKVERLSKLGRPHVAIESLGVVWVLLLVGAGLSYLVWRRRPTPVLLGFLAFSALATIVNMRVYSEVNAYARVLIALPFLAAALARDEDRRWRRAILIGGVVLASAQGGYILQLSVHPAWRQFRHRSRSASFELHRMGLRITGVRVRSGAPWHVRKNQEARLTSLHGSRWVSLGVQSGTVSIRRRGREILSLEAHELATLPAGRRERGLEVRGMGRDGAWLKPLATISSAPAMRDGATLIPVAADTSGLDASRWTTTLAMTNRSAGRVLVGLTFVRRNAFAGERSWAQVTLGPGQRLVLEDVVPRLFDVHSAGALFVSSSGDMPQLRCRIAHRTSQGIWRADVPVLSSSEVAAMTRAPWRLRIHLDGGGVRASVMVVNPRAQPITVRVNTTGAMGSQSVSRELHLDGWAMKQMDLPVNPGASELQVAVSSLRGPAPVGLVSITQQSTGRFNLYWPRSGNR